MDGKSPILVRLAALAIICALSVLVLCRAIEQAWIPVSLAVIAAFFIALAPGSPRRRSAPSGGGPMLRLFDDEGTGPA